MPPRPVQLKLLSQAIQPATQAIPIQTVTATAAIPIVMTQNRAMPRPQTATATTLSPPPPLRATVITTEKMQQNRATLLLPATPTTPQPVTEQLTQAAIPHTVTTHLTNTTQQSVTQQLTQAAIPHIVTIHLTPTPLPPQAVIPTRTIATLQLIITQDPTLTLIQAMSHPTRTLHTIRDMR